MIRTFGLAISVGFGLANPCFAESVAVTALDVETKFFAPPALMELPGAGRVVRRMCVAAVPIRNSQDLATITTPATKDGECPTDVASYFGDIDKDSQKSKAARFDESKIFNVRKIEDRKRLLKTFPTAISYSFLNPITGKEEFEAVCSAFTYLDPRVHKGDSDRKLIHYKRTPIPQKLESLDDEVRCGDINYAYENEIKLRAPKSRQLIADDTVAHDKFVGRSKTDSTPTAKGSNHQQGK